MISPDKVISSIGRHMLVDVVPVIIDLERSQGNRLVDADSGKSYLDCFSYIASNPVGHNHPLMHDAAFEKKLLRCARTKPSSSDFYCSEMAEFVETFARVALPKEFRHLFFIEGGALAVENALKTAFDWKVRKNMEKSGAEDLGSGVIHFRQAFHGRTGYTLSLTNTADPRKTKYFPKFDWPRVLNPKITLPLTPENLKKAEELEAQAEQEIVDAFYAEPDNVAAILIEPIQGEGGDNHFRPEFHQRLRELTDKYDALLIYDEVQTGLGLTGKMWAYEHYGIVPDIVCFGKKTQVCGIMAGQRIDEVQKNVFVECSRLNSTWGGGLADMARSQRYLEIIEQEKLVANAAKVGDYLLKELQALAGRHPQLLSNARGKGLLCAIDASSGEKRDQIFSEAFDRQVLVLKCGTSSIRFRPSLTFSAAEVDEVIAVLDECAKEIEKLGP